ncbi:Trans-1,2-dihydrobenzene-1,2-diol dehydrogenase [Portunus trituberculatus]|uniref:Trans-1,2-dihydrobenzene-1,2-diol dehydrogenase n=1 Tax=Portunus trituberculatus TaxID=210409 RepID=A0A5B7IX70_PORTR|nr:Trans-1,2-dihydrobenzene-1,2-diol dehydrogenase [Portunus trituberculatus]
MNHQNFEGPTTRPRGTYHDCCVSRQVHYPMWSPEVIEGPWGKSTHPLPKNSFKFNLINSGGLMYQAVEVRRCLKEGLLESPGMSHAESITLAEVMEQIRTQVGTVYPQDSM